MSSEKTTNYNMNKWAGTDYVKRDEMNQNFDEIDAEMKSHASSLAENVQQLVHTAKYVNIEAFGAKCDTTNGVDGTDDTISIQNAINSMVSGDTLLIPKKCKITNVTFNPPNYCNLICKDTIYSSASGVAFKIGEETTSSAGYNVQGLKIQSPIRDWAANRIGVKLTNVCDSTIFIDRIYGFENNLLIQGENSNGVVYNKIYLGRLDSGKIGIKLNRLTDGWCNENSFYGGEIKYNIDDLVSEDCYGLYLGLANNNHFYSPSFEGSGGVATAYIIIGEYNQIIFYRAEQIKIGLLDINARYNIIEVGYSDSLTPIVDNGEFNTIIERDFQRYETQATLTIPFMRVKNKFNSNSKYLLLENTSGLETFSIKHTGELWSNLTGYFQQGIRFLSSSGTYTDRGLFVGSGIPEGVVTARQGSIYLDKDGSTSTTLYVKESGTGNTGWVAK